MKYFHVKLTTTFDHPSGKFDSETYLAAENKTQAKAKASSYIFENDGRNCMFYKSPRLEEVSEDAYLEKTQGPAEFPYHAEVDRYLARLVLFGEKDTYDESELRAADAFLASPDEEPEKFAEFNVLCERLAEEPLARGTLLEEVKALALTLFRAQWPSDAAAGTLPPDSVDNAVGNGVGEGVLSKPAGDSLDVVNNSPKNSDRSSKTLPGSRTWADVELDIVLAGIARLAGADDADNDTLSWARKTLDRRPGEVMAWVLGLRKVRGVLAYGSDFIFDLVRGLPAGIDVEHDSCALDAHITSFLREYGLLYLRKKRGGRNTGCQHRHCDDQDPEMVR